MVRTTRSQAVVWKKDWEEKRAVGCTECVRLLEAMKVLTLTHLGALRVSRVAFSVVPRGLCFFHTALSIVLAAQQQ